MTEGVSKEEVSSRWESDEEEESGKPQIECSRCFAVFPSADMLEFHHLWKHGFPAPPKEPKPKLLVPQKNKDTSICRVCNGTGRISEHGPSEEFEKNKNSILMSITQPHKPWGSGLTKEDAAAYIGRPLAGPDDE